MSQPQSTAQVSVQISNLANDSIQIGYKYRNDSEIPASQIIRLHNLPKSSKTVLGMWTGDLPTAQTAAESLRRVERAMIKREQDKRVSQGSCYLWADQLYDLEDEENVTLVGKPAESLVWQSVFDLRKTAATFERTIRQLTSPRFFEQPSNKEDEKELWRMGVDIVNISEHLGLNPGESSYSISFPH